MAPQGPLLPSGVVNINGAATEDKESPRPKAPSTKNPPLEIVWGNAIHFACLHTASLYGAYLFFTKAMWHTWLFTAALYFCSGLGITAGVHRLWAHQAYKARLPLRILLMIFNTIAYQDPVLHWARDHRVHHKYPETDADPHNADRGLFFSHVGWLMVRKHPEIKAKGRTIDVSDLYADPVVFFQKKYYYILMPLFCFILPTYIPTLWGESAWNAFFVCAIFRYTLVLNVSWLVNSAAHKWGAKPYDQTIRPTQIKALSFVVLGEGFHNYHHTFPWDYKSAELGGYSFNLSKLFIDAMSMIGWAYDLKTVSPDVVKKQVEKTGDGSHPLWGWGDKDISLQDKKVTKIVYPTKTE